MMALLWALIWLVLLVLLIIILVISLPVRVDARFNTTQKPGLNMTVSILGGLIPIPIKSPDPNKIKKPKKKRKKKPKSGKPFHIKPIVQALPRLLSSLLQTVKLEKLQANIGYGFPDPADTGMTYGLLKPVELWVDRHDPVNLTIAPDFGVARFDGRGQFAARFTPANLLPPALRFGWVAFIAPRYKR